VPSSIAAGARTGLRVQSRRLHRLRAEPARDVGRCGRRAQLARGVEWSEAALRGWMEGIF
jgi:hypothetical protein